MREPGERAPEELNESSTGDGQKDVVMGTPPHPARSCKFKATLCLRHDPNLFFKSFFAADAVGPDDSSRRGEF